MSSISIRSSLEGAARTRPDTMTPSAKGVRNLPDAGSRTPLDALLDVRAHLESLLRKERVEIVAHLDCSLQVSNLRPVGNCGAH